MKKTAHRSTDFTSFLQKKPALWGTGIVVGVLLTLGISYIRAASTGVLYGCVREHIGLLRIVSEGQRCLPQETKISWNIQGPPGPPGPAAPAGQTETAGGVGVGSFISNKLTGYTSSDENLNYRAFDNVDFTDASMTGVDFTNSSLANTNFTNAKLNGAQMARVNAKGANFTKADLSSDAGSAVYTSADFSNANFTDTNLRGVTLANATVTGATWNNTICPDGTNSNNTKNTCEGHLNP